MARHEAKIPMIGQFSGKWIGSNIGSQSGSFPLECSMKVMSPVVDVE
jgi:hypothetical protein